MPSADDVVERLSILQKQDWERITLQLLKYAAKTFFAAGIPIQNGAVRRVSLSDLVQDAIASAYSTDEDGRNWDPEKTSLQNFLFGAVRSNLSNLFNLHEVQKVDAWPAEKGEEDSPAAISFGILIA